jgi:hypothetical protein
VSAGPKSRAADDLLPIALLGRSAPAKGQPPLLISLRIVLLLVPIAFDEPIRQWHIRGMENRRAIHIRNIVAALWVGFGVPLACIWVLIGDRLNWLSQRWGLMAIVLVTYFAPAVFLTILEVNRRKSKARRCRPS